MRQPARFAALTVVALLALVACGSPDIDRSAATRPSTVASTTVESSSADLSTLSVASSAPPSVDQSLAQATALGAQAVVPWGPVTADDIARAVALVTTLSTPQKAGAVIVASSGEVVDNTVVGELGLAGANLLGTKGVVNGTSNGTPAEVAAVTAALQAQLPAAQAGFPLLIATDQEAGTVTRLVNGFTELPGQGALGSIDDLATAADLTRQATTLAAAEMAAVGINLDFAPVSDVLPVSGSSAIGDRSYGSDPDRVAALVAAAVTGYQSRGVAATVKHFPGLGEVAADSHLVLSTVKADCVAWNGRASAPVRAGIAAGVTLVMTGHVLFPAVDTGPEPSSLSSLVVTQLLRGDPAVPLAGGCSPTGFRGVSVSDSLVMAPIVESYSTGEAAWRALAAGQDIVLMPASSSDAIAGIVGAVGNGQLAETRLNEAAVRVFALRSSLSRLQRPALDTVGSADHQAQAAAIWARIP